METVLDTKMHWVYTIYSWFEEQYVYVYLEKSVFFTNLDNPGYMYIVYCTVYSKCNDVFILLPQVENIY